MKNFHRPMLAAPLLKSNVEHTNENILAAMQQLKYPVLATLKLDGIRAIKLGELASRTLKRIPNLSIQKRAEKLPAYFDMELFNPSLSYDEVESIVMSREHLDSDKIQFHVLDKVDDLSYDKRCSICWEEWAQMYRKLSYNGDTFPPLPIEFFNSKELLDYFIECEQQEGEGICFRTPDSPYKQGRSTLKEQYLVKLCRNLTSEAMIIGFKEAMENTNRATVSELGLTERSSHGHNMVGKNTLGSLVVRDLVTNKEFKIGTGFDDKIRFNIWHEKQAFINKIITYKYKGGGKDLPRCPVFKNFRKDI
jgi:DNA ligase-1